MESSMDIFLVYFCVIFASLFIYFTIFHQRSYRLKEVEERDSSFLFSKLLRNFGFWLLEPIFWLIYRFRIKPDTLTMSSLFFSIISACFYAFGEVIAASIALAFASMCDALDGRVARVLNLQSKKGEFLDSSVDRFSDGVIFGSILFFYRMDTMMFFVTMVILLSSMNISYLRAKGEALGISNNVGLMQRPERFLILGFSGVLSPLIAILFSYLSAGSILISSMFFFKIALIFLSISIFFTSLRRLIFGVRTLSSIEKA